MLRFIRQEANSNLSLKLCSVTDTKTQRPQKQNPETKQSMSQENHPSLPTERLESKDFLERFYRQPQIEENPANLVIQSTPETKVALYECNLCKRKYKRQGDLINHNERVHSYFNFVCSVCKQNLQMSQSNMIAHFKSHEDQILNETFYEKEVDNPLFTLYTKNFGDRWPLTVFEAQNLVDITEIVRINALLKKRLLVKISCKLWFIPKPASEEKAGKYIWSSLPNILIEWNDLNIKRKILNFGRAFMASFLEKDSIEDNGSGYVYYSTSDISIKCIKYTKFGCFLPWENKYKQRLETLTKRKLIFNPECDTFCMRECLQKFSASSGINLNLGCDILEKSHVSFQDIEDWDQRKLNFGLRIIILNEDNLETAYAIFVSDFFHTQSVQINLLAIPNANTNDSAHLILILNLPLMLKTLKNFANEKSTKKIHFCRFCLQKNSLSLHVISLHENYCLNNPDTYHHKDDAKLYDRLEFEDKKTFLKCSDKGRSPPNWIGFVDFETAIPSNIHNLEQEVCKKHKLLGHTTCKCAISSKSDSLNSLSYALIIVDFNTHEVLSEIFYIQKSSLDLTVPEHFVLTLKKLGYAFQVINEINFPIQMNDAQKEFHRSATHCKRCNIKFSNRTITEKVLKNIHNQNFGNIKTIDNSLVVKTAHHLHHLKESNFAATICSRCNLGIQSRYQNIPIFCHNFGRFDHVLILKELCKAWPKDLHFIPKSLNNIMCINAYPFSLKDSLNFLSGSLDQNITIVKQSCLKSCEKCDVDSKCKLCELESEKSLANIFSTIYQSDVSKVKEQVNKARFCENLKKSAFPYSILTSYKDLKDMKVFPEQESFYSILRKESNSETEYLLAKQYFYRYCDNMLDFLKVYNLLDVHLLYSVWRVMSETLSNQFGFYLEQFVSLPGYSFEVAKSFIHNSSIPGYTCIEMFTEKNKQIYFQSLKNIRGGVVQVNSRFELDDRFRRFLSKNSSDLSPLEKTINEELLYLDATNLYGFSLSSLLPCGDYSSVSSSFLEALNKLISVSDANKKNRILDEILPDDSSQGYAFEIKIINIPERLHEFPPFFAQQTVKMTEISEIDRKNYKDIDGKDYPGNKCKRLLPLLKRGTTTFCHYKLLKQAVKFGASVEILSGISFTQKFLFKDYIAILAKLRAETDNPAHSNAFKLLSNALFGKLLQSVFKYNKNYSFFCIDDWEKIDFQKLNTLVQDRHHNAKKKMFKDIKIFSKDFFAVETQYSTLKASNCPLIAFTILELAKTRNFSFFWKMKELSPTTQMLYCDTDSFIIKCSKEWYNEMKQIKKEFDFSKASIKFSHLMQLTTEDKQENKGIIGKYKSEIDKNDILVGYIALQKKCYCLLTMRQMKCSICQKYSALCQCVVNYGGKQLYYIVDNPSAKGKDVKQLSFANYLESLSSNRWNCESRYKISQENKKLRFEFKRYKSIMHFDDSNFSLDCGIHNAPFSFSNHTLYKCYDPSCKKSSMYINQLDTWFKKLKEMLFYFENGELKTWSLADNKQAPQKQSAQHGK